MSWPRHCKVSSIPGSSQPVPYPAVLSSTVGPPEILPLFSVPLWGIPACREKLTLKKRISGNFSVFTKVCSYHPYLIPEHIHQPQKETHQLSPFILSPKSQQQPESTFHLCICLVWTCHTHGIIQYVAFCVWLFHLMFQVHVCHSVYQYIIPFSGRVILHYMDRQQLIDSSIEWFPPFGSYGCLTVCFFPLFLLRHK